jgi:hypothetical protein
VNYDQTVLRRTLNVSKPRTVKKAINPMTNGVATVGTAVGQARLV